MLLPGRHANTSDYRYGFNGMEKDDELKGEGNSYDFGARMLDPRVGRWFARDPLEDKYPSLSTYNYAANMPTLVTDPDGRDIFILIKGPKGKSRLVKFDHNMTARMPEKGLPPEVDLALRQLRDQGGLKIKYPDEDGTVIDIFEFFMKGGNDIVIIPNNKFKNDAGLFSHSSTDRSMIDGANHADLNKFRIIDFDPRAGIIFSTNKSTGILDEDLFPFINNLNAKTGVSYLRDNMGVHSPVLQLAHEILHVFNAFHNAAARKARSNDEGEDGIIDGRRFSNKEEQFVLSLMRQVNAKFEAPNPFDHTATSFRTSNSGDIEVVAGEGDRTRARNIQKVKDAKAKSGSSNGNKGHSESRSKPGGFRSPRHF